MTDEPSPRDPATLRLEFCGSWMDVSPERPFTIGREADLTVDDNPYLHRTFLVLRWDQLWWLDNVGTALAATVSDGDGMVQSWCAPRASLPLVFGVTEVRFTAGPTNYELFLHLGDPPLTTSGTVVAAGGMTTLQPTPLTQNQKRLVLALAENALLQATRTTTTIPSSADAAARLGWQLTKFNRQLDAVCQKLTKAGVRGLHGSSKGLASSRRARLVEYALAVRLVQPDDLPLLDQRDESTAAEA